jgi:hypothetical protein
MSMAMGAHAHAADAVTDAMQTAYAPYRVALVKTNGQSQVESQQAVKQAQQAWTQLTSQFGTTPTAPYDRDAAFAASLAEVALVYSQAAAEVAANQLATAHNTLERVREVTAEMRHRNQVIVFSDHMNAYHRQMELLLREGEKTLAQANGPLQLSSTVGVLNYLALNLTREAPATLLNNEEFMGLLKAVTLSAQHLQATLMTNDLTAVKEAMRKLKSPYSKLFLKFG